MMWESFLDAGREGHYKDLGVRGDRDKQSWPARGLGIDEGPSGLIKPEGPHEVLL